MAMERGSRQKEPEFVQRARGQQTLVGDRGAAGWSAGLTLWGNRAPGAPGRDSDSLLGVGLCPPER